MTRSDKFIAIHVVAGAVLLCAGLLGTDRVIAEALRSSGQEAIGLFISGTVFLDTATGKEVSKFLVGFVLMGLGAVLLFLARTRNAGRNLLFVGLVQFCATLVAGVTKNAFGRLRPFQVLENGDWAHAWFVGGNSFPSGHTAFYFGLFMPLAYLFPRWRWPLMLVPWFIAVARVDANDHFLSDVAVSIVLSGALTWVFATWLSRRQD